MGYIFLVLLFSLSSFMYAQLIWFCGVSNLIRLDFSSDLIGQFCDLFITEGAWVPPFPALACAASAGSAVVDATAVESPKPATPARTF